MESDFQSIADEVNKLSPRFVGVKVDTLMYHHSIEICRRINPEIPIILGGINPTALPKKP